MRLIPPSLTARLLSAAALLPLAAHRLGSVRLSAQPDADADASLRLVQLQTLQQALSRAVGAEDYARAATLRDQLASLKLEGEVGVLAANAEFYRAFTERDLPSMQALWLDGDAPHVACAHPGHPPLYGYDEVIDSWRHIFSDASVEVAPQEVRCYVHGMVARVTCIEDLRQGGGQLVAINLFEWHEDRWRMVLHQAGPLMA